MCSVIQRRISFIVLFGFWSNAQALAADGQQLLQTLRDADREFFAGATLSLTITEPVDGILKDRGTVTWEGTLVASGERQGLILRGVHFEPPVYKPLKPGNHQAILLTSADYQATDYDSDGNLLLCRLQDAFALKTADSNDAYETWACVHLAPTSVIVDQGKSSKLARFAVSDEKSLAIWKYRRIVPATGRGFAQFLDTISEVQTLPSGLIVLDGTGEPWKRLRLTLDPAAGYLVRTAEFLGNKDEPFEVVSTTGTLTEDGLTVPTRGTITMFLGPGRERATNVEFHGASRSNHEEVIQHIKAQFSEDNLPIGTTIEDYRADSASYHPVRTWVGEN